MLPDTLQIMYYYQVEMLRVEKLAQEMEEKIDPKVRENVKALVSKLVGKKSRLQD